MNNTHSGVTRKGAKRREALCAVDAASTLLGSGHRLRKTKCAAPWRHSVCRRPSADPASGIEAEGGDALAVRALAHDSPARPDREGTPRRSPPTKLPSSAAPVGKNPCPIIPSSPGSAKRKGIVQHPRQTHGHSDRLARLAYRAFRLFRLLGLFRLSAIFPFKEEDSHAAPSQ